MHNISARRQPLAHKLHREAGILYLLAMLRKRIRARLRWRGPVPPGSGQPLVFRTIPNFLGPIARPDKCELDCSYLESAAVRKARPHLSRRPSFLTPTLAFSERVLFLSAKNSSEPFAQFRCARHDIRGGEIRELGRYRRQLLRMSEGGIGFPPLLAFQMLEEALKVIALASVQGTLVTVDRAQELLEPAG